LAIKGEHELALRIESESRPFFLRRRGLVAHDLIAFNLERESTYLRHVAAMCRVQENPILQEAQRRVASICRNYRLYPSAFEFHLARHSAHFVT
jgi:hypothetical protein